MCFVGQIRSIATQTTNITYKVDDGTGTIEVKHWIDSDAKDAIDMGEDVPQQFFENNYVRIYGSLKVFGNKRHVGSQIIRPVKDFNEINYHLLAATAEHLYFTKGPPEQFKANIEGANQAGSGTYGGEAGTFNGKQLPSMSASARRVYNQLASAPQNNEGLHVQNIAAQLKMPINDIYDAGQELLGHGLIFTTVDEETWTVLEF